jgi:hypothetical protein
MLGYYVLGGRKQSLHLLDYESMTPNNLEKINFIIKFLFGSFKFLLILAATPVTQSTFQLLSIVKV